MNMNIKCPRCVLNNKPGVVKCQSCGDDLSELTGKMESEANSESGGEDPLSIDRIRKKRKTGNEHYTRRESHESSELPLNWRGELERKVEEIKRERAGGKKRGRKKASHQKSAAEADYEYEEQEEDYDDLPDDDFSIAARKVDDIVKEFKDNKADDLNNDQSVDNDYDELEDEEPKGRGEKLPSDTEELKDYIAKIVERRHGKSKPKKRTAADEYGYKRYGKKETKKASKERSYQSVPVERKEYNGHDDIESPFYRPIEEEKPASAVKIFQEESRNLINMKRIYAAVWDNIILMIMSLIIFKFGANVTDVTLLQLINLSWEKLLAFHLLLAAVYHIYFTTSNGQTIGKMFMNIRVMNADGSQVKFSRVLFHFFLSLPSIAAAMVGFLWFFFDAHGRNLPDLLLSTSVELYND